MTKSTSILTDPYIYVEKNVLTKHRCKSIINRFNKDNRRHQGVTAGGLLENIKQSTDLNITDHIQGWEQHDKHLHAKLTPLLERYYANLNKNFDNHFFNNKELRYDYNPPINIIDTGYQIQRTEAGQGYVWHNDFAIDNLNNVQSTRLLTFIFYLNTVDEGWTQFYNGDQISPETGNACIFPATWTYVHQGYPPKQTKYIVTGWVYVNGYWQE